MERNIDEKNYRSQTTESIDTPFTPAPHCHRRAEIYQTKDACRYKRPCRDMDVNMLIEQLFRINYRYTCIRDHHHNEKR
jgi:hypothetical protein